jgi:glutamate decarboxylase
MPPDLEEMAVLRIVVRNGFGHDLAELLMDDLRRAVERLDAGGGAPAQEHGSAFHH